MFNLTLDGNLEIKPVVSDENKDVRGVWDQVGGIGG
jgi:hypothetical protein